MPVLTEPRAANRPWALRNLPPLPRVAMRLLQILSQEESVMQQIVELIRMDAAVAAEILRLANSAVYGHSSRIDNLLRAVVMLGREKVKALCTTVAMSMYTRPVVRYAALGKCWRHSLACAFLSEGLATACSIDRDQAYTAGLVHDIGRLGLLVGYPMEYSRLIEVSVEDSLDILEVERSMFDGDHCEIGRWLAEEWEFPADLRDVIANHHAVPPEGPPTLRSVVSLACRLADTLDFHAVVPKFPSSFDELRDQLPSSARNALEAGQQGLAASIRRKVDSVTRM